MGISVHGVSKRFKDFVGDCMNDYDVDGWARGPWVNEVE